LNRELESNKPAGKELKMNKKEKIQLLDLGEKLFVSQNRKHGKDMCGGEIVIAYITSHAGNVVIDIHDKQWGELVLKHIARLVSMPFDMAKEL